MDVRNLNFLTVRPVLENSYLLDICSINGKVHCQEKFSSDTQKQFQNIQIIQFHITDCQSADEK